MRNDISIGANIARIRKEAKLTQEDLAARLGVTKASVSKWETGQSYPDITLLPRIATLFGISVDELIGYEPQLSKATIRDELARLRMAFSEEPFEAAHAKCRTLIRDYYSCYPLLVQIANMYLNHASLAPEPEREPLMCETIDICRHVREHSSSSGCVKQATATEAAMVILSGKPQEAIDLLSDAMELQMGEALLLANAYQMLGQSDKAVETLQVDLYQSLTLSLNELVQMAAGSMGDAQRLKVIHRRALKLMDAFDIDTVYVNAGAIHISFASIFMQAGDVDSVFECLERYVQCCRSLQFPLRLHGDDFFDKIDAWLIRELDTGGDAPRSDELVKHDLLASVAANPLFAPLSDDPRFKLVVANLEEAAR